jgi:nicotinate-nucleotide pyrophosphorylase (carboxylating)
MDTSELMDDIIQLALDEDGDDITSEAVFRDDSRLRAGIKAKEPGIIAGVRVALRVFALCDPGIEAVFEVEDGLAVHTGQRIAVVTGPARGILKAERVVLNFMQRMSGIATKTAEYVKCLEGTGARILDTRKTAPGQRVLDKMA